MGWAKISGNPTGFFQDLFSSVIANAKAILDIGDSVDDTKLTDFGTIISSEIISKVYPFSNGLPLDGDYLTMANNAAVQGVCSLYKASKNNDNLAKFYEGRYKTLVEALIESLQANRNTRTQRVAIQSDYQTQRSYAELRKW